MQVVREGAQNMFKGAIRRPLLESTMAGLVGRIASRQVMPRRPGAENPQNTIEHRSVTTPRTTPAIAAFGTRRQQWGHYRPLFVCKIHKRYLRKGIPLT